jgi:deoxyhypusine synthase
MERHFLHFNARETLHAAQAYKEHVEAGGKMLLALAGAMSTAEIGITLAPMIRSGKVHAISCTAANYEEDVFNLLAHNEYQMVPHYRDLSPDDETRLFERGLNRVTDTCIPESAIRHLEDVLLEYWRQADQACESHPPSHYVRRMFAEDRLAGRYQIPAEHSWVLAAHEADIPIYTPGFEDSTMGNIFAARVMDGALRSHAAVQNGTAQMEHLARWYQETSTQAGIGFFQIGGGIAGDFAICAVPLLRQDLGQDVPLWSYFAQISDSTTSYGSYSGAVPNEKITWCKLDKRSPKYMINSDASLVAPLIFAYVLGY